MMNSFAAVNAKIDHMLGVFPSDEDLLALAKQGTYQEVLDLANRLKAYEFLDPNLDIYGLDQELKRQAYTRAKKLQYFLQGPYKEFLKAYGLNHEYEEIKRVLRALRAGKDLASIGLHQIHLGNKTISLKNEEIGQFVDRLSGTRYYDILRAYQGEDQEVILFYMEMNLDKFYYQDLLKSVEGFSKKDQAWFKETIGRKIDLYNLLWIIRAKTYYKLLNEELVNFSILGGHSLDFKDIQDLAYTESLDELKKKIEKTDYAFLLEGKDIYLLSNRRMRRYLYYHCRGLLKKTKASFGKVLCYLLILENEVNDFRILFETARFGLQAEEKLKYLARHIKGSGD